MAPSPEAIELAVDSGGSGGPTPGVSGRDTEESLDFRVSVGVFDGPFDLLLTLISKHELDITEIALSRVTDEFIRYVRTLQRDEELERASEFIVVAATLLDMKIVSLLPQGEYVDAEAVAVLEARDLLFARLLQYRAFKEATAWFSARLGIEDTRTPRNVPLEPALRERLPELVWTLSVDDFAALATAALAPKPEPEVGLSHLHAPLVSIREQAAVVIERLADGAPKTFGELIADADATGIVVARFLAVLELYRRSALSFAQDEPLGVLTVTWDAERWNDDDLATLGADFDR
ncbi:segregation/condensation protein A [Pseudoclavibacter endophyticus]|uniref:segregation and condensation protein A n=1 Tax=Pseudoclavibacter endophyticus TaxID=1778590 RepID=UPI0019CB924F|nr:ScpA family protein [Pseudoclavibacter endophyticus]GGA54356.1 segregation/condensation protein A [Pseudoclavibacter endophyticus]